MSETRIAASNSAELFRPGTFKTWDGTGTRTTLSSVPSESKIRTPESAGIGNRMILLIDLGNGFQTSSTIWKFVAAFISFYSFLWRHKKSPNEGIPHDKSPIGKSPSEEIPNEEISQEESPHDKSPIGRSPNEKSPDEDGPNEESPNEKSHKH